MASSQLAAIVGTLSLFESLVGQLEDTPPII
jgi:hypothetical protein